MSLQSAWVDRIFEKLVLVYGHAFLRRWEGLDLAKVKADWAHELRGFAQSPDAISYALEHLPGDGAPPTVLQFRHLCQQCPQVTRATALPAPPPANPQRVAQALAQLGERRPQPRDPKACAWALKAREERGDRLTKAQRDMWRAALQAELQRKQTAEAEAAAVEVAP